MQPQKRLSPKIKLKLGEVLRKEPELFLNHSILDNKKLTTIKKTQRASTLNVSWHPSPTPNN